MNSLRNMRILFRHRITAEKIFVRNYQCLREIGGLPLPGLGLNSAFVISQRCHHSCCRCHSRLLQYKVTNPRYMSTSGGETVKKKKRKEEKPLPDIDGFNREVIEYKREKDSTSPLPVTGGPAQYTFRSHTCGQLTAEDVGKRVTLCGWLTFKRLNGTFIVLRDLYGTTQVYVPSEIEDLKKVEEAPLESVIQISGMVSLRPEKQRKKDHITGEIEVVVDKVTVLNKPSDLRLAYNDYDKADEEIGMQYRYLYLRNAQVQANLRKRAVFLSNVRRFMDANHFIDIETPTLIRRTPGVLETLKYLLRKFGII